MAIGCARWATFSANARCLAALAMCLVMSQSSLPAIPSGVPLAILSMRRVSSLPTCGFTASSAAVKSRSAFRRPLL